MADRIYDVDVKTEYDSEKTVTVHIRYLAWALSRVPAAFAGLLSDLFNSGGWGRSQAQAVAKYFLREHRCLQANLVLFCTQLVVSFYEQYVTEWHSTAFQDLDSIDLDRITDPRNKYALEVARKVAHAVRQDI